MGNTTKKTEAAAPAASVTTTPVVEAPVAETVSLEVYNLAVSSNEKQSARIEELAKLLDESNKKVAELEGEISIGRQSIADMLEKLRETEITALRLAHQVEFQTKGVLVEKTTETSAEPKTSFDYNGRTYGFVKGTPANLFHDDRLYTQCELLNDPEAMISLIVGENGFIKQLQ